MSLAERLGFDQDQSEYAWVITEDLIADADEPEGSYCNAVGLAGPSDAPEDLLAAVRAGKGRAFRVYDDDGELYYRGRCTSRTNELDEDFFGPLWDFAQGNAGATEIRYIYNVPGLEGYEDKKWRAL